MVQFLGFRLSQSSIDLLPQLDYAIATARGHERLFLRSTQNQISDDIVVAD